MPVHGLSINAEYNVDIRMRKVYAQAGVILFIYLFIYLIFCLFPSDPYVKITLYDSQSYQVIEALHTKTIKRVCHLFNFNNGMFVLYHCIFIAN